jgi:hypothetical protein
MLLNIIKSVFDHFHNGYFAVWEQKSRNSNSSYLLKLVVMFVKIILFIVGIWCPQLVARKSSTIQDKQIKPREIFNQDSQLSSICYPSDYVTMPSSINTTSVDSIDSLSLSTCSKEEQRISREEIYQLLFKLISKEDYNNSDSFLSLCLNIKVS